MTGSVDTTMTPYLMTSTICSILAAASGSPPTMEVSAQVLAVSRISRRYSCRGYLLRSVRKIMALKQEFHWATSAYSAMTAIMALDRGSTMLKKYRWLVQPSMKAASCSSLGSVDTKNERMIMMLYTDEQPSITIKSRLLTRFRDLTTRQKGISPPPKYMVKTNRAMKMLRPGKSLRERAYPAITCTATASSVPAPAYSRVLAQPIQMRLSANTREQPIRVNPRGYRSGVPELTYWGSLTEASSTKYRG